MVEFHLCHSLCGCGFFRGTAERSFVDDFDKTFVNYVLKLLERRVEAIIYSLPYWGEAGDTN